MSKVNSNKGIETEFRHFSMRNIQIWHLFFFSKHITVFQWLSKSTFLSFLTKVKPNNGYATKLDIFPRDIFKSDIIFIGHKILKYFNDFYNWHFSISLQKWAKSSKVNKIMPYMCKYGSIFLFIVVRCINDFEIYFLERFIIKGNWTHLAQKNSQPGSKIKTTQYIS